MFYFQCQEAANSSGCTVRGVCGKSERTANLQDLLICVLKGISILGLEVKRIEHIDKSIGLFVAKSHVKPIDDVSEDIKAMLSGN